ncbi:ABC transporter ATP-binding protein [Rhizobium sp. LC145]|jgi:peptide/nickel transport system ATP-binding protein|uniref:dipeptide ABC transporter ATP-binding protein n=1 Tax=Rhizobium sp. LC145 TaxID=1120688 RepID=UPI00062A3D2A|nr:ABC transporter ATP-binding protein [Rhizobium sp. LC145]KKX25749.1 ABC transporter ATP-binding protein [Rhizobium sp. LC145]TKT58041.1 ABC transporter ATP-binding protein [Rhizobiaceae bacterium LC148]
MKTKPDLLRIENLSVSFPVFKDRIDAVKNLSMRIRPGKVTALVGESGSGKSVIGRTIVGLESPIASIAGRILFNDPVSGEAPVDLLSLPRDGRQIRHIRGNRIGMIFQEPMTSFSPLHTVGNQIAEALRIHDASPASEQIERIDEMLSLVGFKDPAKVRRMYPFELSGGMRQRAMIASALICRPALLIADEPTTALDVTIQAQILKLLRELQERFHMAMLLITHDLGIVTNLADEVVVAYRGTIMESGTVDDIFRRTIHPYPRGLMAAVPHFDMRPGDRLKPLREITVDSSKLLGRGPSGSRGETDVILSVRNVSKTFTTRKSGFLGDSGKDKIRAVSDVSFDIRRGESLGLVGESGSGKTTLSKILMRGVSSDSGSVIFHDHSKQIDVLNASGSELDIVRQKIQMVFQDPVSSLSPRMTVRNIVGEGLDIHDRGNRRERLDTVLRLIRAMGLDDGALTRYPHSFSGGQRQRIGIARALALGPELLICDEPVSALDVSVQAQILNLMKDLKNDLDLTYLFVSHNLAVVNYMADRVAVMHAARIVEIGPCEIILKNPVHPYTRKLIAAIPVPDLDRPLDFTSLARATGETGDWGRQFLQGNDQNALAYADLGNGHLVLARETVDARELRP